MAFLVQKKLRHVRRIVVRNIVSDKAPVPLDCYYTLSTGGLF